MITAEVAECRPLAGRGCSMHYAEWKRDQGICYSDLEGSDDGMCFANAVARYLMDDLPRKEAEQWRQRGGIREWKAANLVFPRPIDPEVGMLVKHVGEFEEANKHLDIAINIVYKDEKRHIFPIRASGNIQARNQIPLALFYKKVEDDKGVIRHLSHYALIGFPEKLLANRHEGGRKVTPVRICWNCFQLTTTGGAYQNHVSFCHKNQCQKVILPDEDSWMTYQPTTFVRNKEQLLAYTLFFDFEALQVSPANGGCSCPPHVLENTRKMREEGELWQKMTPEERERVVMEEDDERNAISGEWIEKCEAAERRGRPLPKEPDLKLKGPPRRRVCRHATQVLREQPAFMYSLLLVDRNKKVLERETYTGDDADLRFMQSLLNIAETYVPSLSPGLPMNALSPPQVAAYNDASACYLCDEPFSDWDGKVRDHDHLTGEYLGPAHSSCNLKRVDSGDLTVIAHNLSGYDSHFLVRTLAKLDKRIHKISSIPINTQKFKSLTLNGHIRFLDSSQFLAGTLDDLVSMLKKSGSQFDLLDGLVANGEQKELIKRKGVYPYLFATSIEALDACRSLPEKAHFHHSITGEPCSSEDYEHARRVWNAFECENMLQYTAIYVKADVHLLAEVVMDFRAKIWSNFGLDMCHYLSLPHLSMDCMLKTTGVSIQHMHDQEMIELIRGSIRGGHSFVNTRYLVRRDEDFVLHSSGNWGRGKKFSMQLLDVNNLYGFAMRQSLPRCDYRWMEVDELESYDPEQADNGSPFGHILVVDLEYPSHLHELHNSFPLAVEPVEIPFDDLSSYSRRLAEQLGYAGGRRQQRKLSATFGRRENYVVHGQNLKFYLRMGLRLLRIKKGIVFQQQAFMKDYVDKCSRMRMEADTEVERSMYKLVVNACYGKFIESTAKRMDARFERSRASAMASATSPLFKGLMICDEATTISFLKKREVKLTQSWLIGFTILELSKLHMGRLYYEYILPRFPPFSVSVAMSDTDSYLLAVDGFDENEVLQKIRDIMDFSNLSKEHPLYSSKREKKPGLLKSEYPNLLIRRVVAVKSKSYMLEIVRRKTANDLEDAVDDMASVCSQFTLSSDVVRGKGEGGSDVDGGASSASDSDAITSTEQFACNVVKAKGVKRYAAKKLSFKSMRSVVKGARAVYLTQNSIMSKQHVNQLVRSRKKAVDTFDNKRYASCEVHTTPFYGKLAKYHAETGRCWACEHPHRLY